jgi:hypothetical protein
VEIKINNVPFVPHPDVGFKTENPKEVNYAHNYPKLVKDVVEKKVDMLLLGRAAYNDADRVIVNQAKERMKRDPQWLEHTAFRTLIQKDLWFLLYFIVKPFADPAGMAVVNHPFVIQACREIEKGDKDSTLDIWARFHFKSSIITIAETIQYQLMNPNHSTGIFSHKAPIAKDFLFTIMSIFERETMLNACFPDVVWADCKREARLWSLDEGIILKRDTNRKEASVSAHGLVEGMPTGLHFERRVYDDISTNDMAQSMDLIEKVNHAFDTSQNLKTLVGSHHRVTGTYYSHNDPLLYIRDKKDKDGNPRYKLRFKPATDDGTANGVPVLMTQEGIDELKGDSSFNCQQLLDPTPLADQRLDPYFLQKIEHQFIPRNLYRFMVIDQAGDQGSNKTTKGDAWAVGVFGVEPFHDNIGQSRIFILDLWVDSAGESQAIDKIVRMFVEGGIVSRIGVEKVGQTTTHLHISNALKAHGRYVEFTDDRRSVGMLLRPAGRHKKKFIEGAFAWPLNNGKWFYSSDVPSPAIDRLKQEMSMFPLWHDDAINICAYLYDMLRDYHFPPIQEQGFQPLYEEVEQKYDPLTYGLGRSGNVKFL